MAAKASPNWFVQGELYTGAAAPPPLLQLLPLVGAAGLAVLHISQAWAAAGFAKVQAAQLQGPL